MKMFEKTFRIGIKIESLKAFKICVYEPDC